MRAPRKPRGSRRRIGGGSGGVCRGHHKALEEHENIEIVHEELTEIPEGPAIIATGPLTSDPMAAAISDYFGGAKGLNFYDAGGASCEL